VWIFSRIVLRFNNTAFNSNASDYIIDAQAPYTGIFNPINSIIYEESQGEWFLKVSDCEVGDAGVVTSWAIEMDILDQGMFEYGNLALTVKDENGCIRTVESGKMTKDLALLIHDKNLTEKDYLSTEDFLEALNQNLQARFNFKTGIV